MAEREGIVSVWIGNLGKYNEGELVGEWLGFPCSKEEFDAVLKRIGIGSMRKENDARYGIYEEYFAADYDDTTGIFYERYGEYPDWKELNILAGILDTFDDDQINAISAYLEEVYNVKGEEFYTLIANIAEGNISLYSDIEDERDYGNYILEEYGQDNISQNTLESYFDFESAGRDLEFENYEVDTTDEEKALYDLKEAITVLSDEVPKYHIEESKDSGDINIFKNEELIDSIDSSHFDLKVLFEEVILPNEDLDIKEIPVDLELWEESLDMYMGVSIDKNGVMSFNSFLDEEEISEIEYVNRDYKNVGAGEYFCGDEDASNYDIGYEYYVNLANEYSMDYFDYESYGRDVLLEEDACLSKNGLLRYFDYDSFLSLDDLDIDEYDWDAQASDLSNEAEIATAQAKETNKDNQAPENKEKGER